MKLLFLGAGAIGGYFGARLVEAGSDVTFLVRPRRAAQLAATGLVVVSPAGDVAIPGPRTVLADALRDAREAFDVVVLSSKAYDLDSALAAIAPAVERGAAVLPLLNGMRHVDALVARFGDERVLGGLCSIPVTLDAEGRVHHFAMLHELVFGERDGRTTDRVRALADAMRPARFDARPSATIVHDMWEKWVFIATLAGIACLTRANVGEMIAAGATPALLGLLEECRSVAAAAGFPPRPETLERARRMLTTPSPLTASMMRDMEKGAPTEAEHVIHDLLRRGQAAGMELPLLTLAWANLAVYEARR